MRRQVYLSLFALTGLVLLVFSFWTPDARSLALSFWAPNGPHIYNINQGFVGIGAMNPIAKLTVNGGLAIGLTPQRGAWNSRVPLPNALTIIDPSAPGAHPSLTIAPDGLPVIVYEGLRVAKCGSVDCSTGNTISFLPPTGGGGGDASVAIGSDGLPVISYSALRVAKCGNPACSAGNVYSTVDSNLGYDGGTSSISIGNDGLPVIAYFDDNLDVLKVAKCGDAFCRAGNSVTILDSTGWIPSHLSLTIGSDGLPVIAYFDDIRDVLKVAKCGNAACSAGNTISVIDGPMAGWNPSISIGNDGMPIIAYSHVTSQQLRVAKCGNTTCTTGNTITVVESRYPHDTSIGIGTDGLPVIAYRVERVWKDGDLKVAKCGNAACSAGNSVVVVDPASDIGTRVSMAIGADGLPLVAYGIFIPYEGEKLRVAHCGSDRCLPYWTRR